MQAVILAGGLATRLGHLASNRPKSLLEFKGKPFLEYQLALLREGGVRDVVLCTGHLGEQIEHCFGDGRKFSMNIVYSREDKALDTAGAIKNATGLLEEAFFTMYGDSYLFLDFARLMTYFRSENKLAMMTVFRNRDNYDRSNTVIRGNLVTMHSKQNRTADMEYIDYGGHVFRKEAFELVPENRPYSLETLFVDLAAKEQLLAYKVDKRFYEVGSPGGVREFEAYVGGVA